MSIERLTTSVLYRGRVVDLIVDTVRLPSGKESIREVARHPGGAAVVPLLDTGEVVLVRQLRYPFGQEIIELPAGKLTAGEDPETAAARELSEETGWHARELTKLASILTTPGFCSEVIHVFLGRQLVYLQEGHKREEGEELMTVRTVMLEEALAMIGRGDIRDAKTIIGLLMARDFLSQRGETV